VGSRGVSAFLSHAVFYPATAFDTPDASHAKASHAKHKSFESSLDFDLSKLSPAFVYVSFGIPTHRSFFAFSQRGDSPQKTDRTKHTSFLGTIQVYS
jgi:hypothetical protein